MRAGEGGVIEVILNAMRTHINNADVCEAGCGALKVIAVDGKQTKKKSRMKQKPFSNKMTTR